MLLRIDSFRLQHPYSYAVFLNTVAHVKSGKESKTDKDPGINQSRICRVTDGRRVSYRSLIASRRPHFFLSL